MVNEMFIYLYRIYCVFWFLCVVLFFCVVLICDFMLCVVLIVFLCFYVLCLLYAPSHQKKFQVGVNLLGNKSHSDSDSDSDSDGSTLLSSRFQSSLQQVGLPF